MIEGEAGAMNSQSTNEQAGVRARDQKPVQHGFAKEVGFEDFRKHNKEFEYRVVRHEFARAAETAHGRDAIDPAIMTP